jgi:hypothetical protein
MDELEFYNRHYIAVDERGRITDGFSDAFRQPSETDICINKQGGYQFRLFPGGEENPALYYWDGIPMYKWDGTAVLHRDAEEIEADRAALPAPEEVPSQIDQIEAQVTYTAMMTNTLLEV